MLTLFREFLKLARTARGDADRYNEYLGNEVIHATWRDIIHDYLRDRHIEALRESGGSIADLSRYRHGHAVPSTHVGPDTIDEWNVGGPGHAAWRRATSGQAATVVDPDSEPEVAPEGWSRPG